MTRPDPLAVQSALQDAYLRYYDTAFRLREEALRAERRALLGRPGVVFTDPLIEPVLPHDPTESITEVCEELSIGADVADQLGRMLFAADGSFRLRDHQAAGLRTSLRSSDQLERNVIVTSGTGSGKTESFLLPTLPAFLLSHRAGVQTPRSTGGGMPAAKARRGLRHARTRIGRQRFGRWSSTRPMLSLRTRSLACEKQ